MSGTAPIRANAMQNRARSDATIKSAASARLNPAPMATPSTAAITGQGSAAKAMTARLATSIRARSSAAVKAMRDIPPTSPPAQKSSPAPVSTTARTCGSRRISSRASSRAAPISAL
ncbi:hypothetical protein D3C72_1646410 [compost metagenome]